MLGVLIIPTGIGCEIGGHAGDANPVAKLIASCCDKLILHPNVVNASDINEMPINSYYVEGSMLDLFLEGEIELEPVTSNKILVVANKPITYLTKNAVAAARATIGLEAEILGLDTPLEMVPTYKNNIASGDVFGWEELVEQVSAYDFDALAVHTPIDMDREVELKYYREGGLNPMGGVEAKASKYIAGALNCPVAHAPFDDTSQDDDEMYHIFEHDFEPRLAAEAISNCYLHCVLKGLFKAPRVGIGIKSKDVDVLVTPINCVGRPHRACIEKNIPVIAVKENKNNLHDKMPEDFIIVDNYLEAAGIIQAMKIGISPKSVRRPLEYTTVYNEK